MGGAGRGMATKARGHGDRTIGRRPDGSREARASAGYKLNQAGKAIRDPRRFSGQPRAEAAKKMEAAQRDHERGLPLPDARQAVAKYPAERLARQRHTAPATCANYALNVERYLIPSLGRHALAKLTPEQVQTFLDAKGREVTRRGTPYSPRAIGQMRAVLRQALAEAEAWGLVPRNVAKLARPPQAKAVRPPRALTTAEAGRLLEAIAGDRLEALYRVALALALRWEHVALEGGALTVREKVQRVRGAGIVASAPKSGAGNRPVPLPRSLIALLRDHRERQAAARARAGPAWPDRGLVFATRTGRPLDGPNVTTYFQRHLARAGLPRLPFHDLRHSAVSFLAADGVPIAVAQRILGHADARPTRNVYRHVLAEEYARAAEARERRFGDR